MNVTDHDQGDKVKTTAQIAKSASTPSTGLCALLSNLLRVVGTGAHKTGNSGVAWAPRRLGLASLLATLGALAFASAPALAAAPEAPEVSVETPVHATEAIFHGVVNPVAAAFPLEAGTYQFVYRPSTKADDECKGAGEVLVPPSAGMYFGLEPESFSETVTGLTAGTEYAVCLVAEDKEGTTPSAPVTFTTSAVAPTIPSEFGDFVTNVASTSATLGAEINPGGAETTYHFEYGTTSSYGQSTPESGLASAGDSSETAAAHIQGLTPHTTYHYRVVATNSQSPGGTPGPDEAFTTQPVGGELKLPDGRVWELVSPAQSEGAAVIYYDEAPFQAAADGSAMTYVESKPTEPEPQGGAYANQVFSWRGPSGWASREINIPNKEAALITVGYGEEYRSFSANLAYGIVEPFGAFDPLLSAEATERTPYLRSNYAIGDTRAACTNSCYRPLVTAANVPPGTDFGQDNEAATEFLVPVKVVAFTPDMSSIVLAGGAALTDPPSPSGEYLWTGGRIEAIPGKEKPVAITDGRIFFELSSNIYVFEAASEKTRLLASKAEFVMASSDGSKIFVIKEGHYLQVEVEDGQVTDLTPNGMPISTSYDHVLGHSQDGSSLFFQGFVGGKHGVYALHEASPEWTTSPVPGALSAGGVVSSNGRYLAFGSTSSLTGYDNRDAVSGKPDQEVYVYDADTEKLACASCNPTGESPSGESYLEGPQFNGLVQRLHGMVAYQPRDVSDGGQVFFNSDDVLVPQDVDGTQDVYEYEQVGGGGCTTSDSTFSEVSGGCVSLVSSGISPQESMFLDASETGGDVFVRTTAKLTSQDPGSAFVVYDAHVCTSEVPCRVPLVPSPPCSTEASCRPAPTPQPSIYGAPSSATFSGAGNIAPVSTVGVKAKVKPLTRAQKLVRALKMCRKKPKHKRAACDQQARRAYGPGENAKKSLKGDR